MRYDIIGDIHGHADKLEALLKTMGYRHRLGAWRHPDSTAIFVGDFIDRGPGQLRTVRIVREMTEAGTALAVMGNHEFNAIAWHTPDPEHDGKHLRPRNDKHRSQHVKFLEEVEDNPDEHAKLIDWFLTLPVWIELPGLRVIHACWHPESMANLAPRLLPGNRIDRALVTAASRHGSPEHDAIETLIKGMEIPLPRGHAFVDKDGHPRYAVRTRWWDTTATTFRKAAIVGEADQESLPDIPNSGIGFAGIRRCRARFLRPLLVDGNPGAPSSARCLCRLQRRSRWPTCCISMEWRVDFDLGTLRGLLAKNSHPMTTAPIA